MAKSRDCCVTMLGLLCISACSTSARTDESSCVEAGALLAQERHNYSFRSRLSFAATQVRPSSELLFDWSELEHDFLGQSMDPVQDVDAVHLLLWKLTLEELEEKLHQDDLRQSDLVVPATLPTERQRTSGTLFELRSAAGVALPPDDILPFLDIEAFPPASHVYTLMVATGDELGQGTRMIQAFGLDAGSDNTLVRVDDGSTRLSHTVDLSSLEATPIQPYQSQIVFDWSELRSNAMGEEFTLARIDKIAVARFDAATEALEDEFLSLIRYDGGVLAETLFTAEVPSGTSIELSALANDAGDGFAGIDTEGTWLLALFCGSCRNPAPWYLTFLKPCAG